MHDARILVADPDASARSHYRELLSVSGYEVVDAGDGREALVKALSQQPVLVITETRLPVFDGYALCEVLRRDTATQTVPILVVTSESRSAALARARSRRQRRAHQTGCARYLAERNSAAAQTGREAISQTAATGAKVAVPHISPRRDDRAATTAAALDLSVLRSAVDVWIQSHRRREPPTGRTVGRVHVSCVVRNVRVSTPHGEAPACWLEQFSVPCST